jgi:hypothetical protein
MLHMAGAANRSLDGAEESCGQLLARMLLLGARAADKALEACLGSKTRAGVARRSSWSSVPPTVAPEQLAVDIDNEAGLQAIKSVQRCYRGKLGRRSVVALSEEVTMSSQLDIKVDDDDQVTHVNDYAMNGVLGQGAYGIVYRAKGVLDPHARGDVAIKVLNRSVLKRKKMGKGTAFDGVLKEISVMKTLCHPNCVQLFEVIDDKTHDCMYLVMEFVAGGDLAAPINRKEHVPEALMRGWMRDAVLGLEHLHSYSILHRDIKVLGLGLGLGLGLIKVTLTLTLTLTLTRHQAGEYPLGRRAQTGQAGGLRRVFDLRGRPAQGLRQGHRGHARLLRARDVRRRQDRLEGLLGQSCGHLGPRRVRVYVDVPPASFRGTHGLHAHGGDPRRRAAARHPGLRGHARAARAAARAAG